MTTNINNTAVNIENLMILSNEPCFAGLTDITHLQIVDHLSGKRLFKNTYQLPSVADGMTESDLEYLKANFTVKHGVNSYGLSDAWLERKGKRASSCPQGYRRVSVNGRQIKEHRALMSLWCDSPLPSWVVVNHASDCTVYDDFGKRNCITNLRMTTSRGNSLDKRVCEGSLNKFTGYKRSIPEGKWKVVPTLLDGSKPTVYTTESETSAYLIRCLILLREYGKYWWWTKGEQRMEPRVNINNHDALLMPHDFGYDFGIDLLALLTGEYSEDIASDAIESLIVEPIVAAKRGYLKEHREDLLGLVDDLLATMWDSTVRFDIETHAAKRHMDTLSHAKNMGEYLTLLKVIVRTEDARREATLAWNDDGEY